MWDVTPQAKKARHMASTCGFYHPHQGAIPRINSLAGEHEMPHRQAAMQAARRLEEPGVILLRIESANQTYQRYIIPHVQLGPYCRSPQCIRLKAGKIEAIGYHYHFVRRITEIHMPLPCHLGAAENPVRNPAGDPRTCAHYHSS